MIESEELLSLKAALVRRRIKQCEVARDLKLHPSTLSQYLNGWIPMPPEIEKKMRDKLRYLPQQMQ